MCILIFSDDRYGLTIEYMLTAFMGGILKFK